MVPAHERELDRQIANVRSPKQLVSGIDITNTSPDILIGMIEATRKRGLPGVVTWYYRGLEKAGAFERLAATVLKEKAELPW